MLEESGAASLISVRSTAKRDNSDIELRCGESRDARVYKITCSSRIKRCDQNTVSPGYIMTAMVAAIGDEILEKIASTIPVGRLGNPDEIAYAVAFLASERAFVTGSNLQSTASCSRATAQEPSPNSRCYFSCDAQ